jgi:hypothetical protein
MNRMDFIKTIGTGGIVVAASSLFNACETATESSSEDDLDAAIQIVTDGANFEAMGIQTYAAAANSGLLVDQTVIDTALLYKSHHEGHLAELNNLLTNFDQPTIEATSASPAPGTSSVTNQTDIILLALDVEFQAATFYFSGIVNEVKNTDVRKVFANIMPVEVAHMVTYKTVLGRNPAIDADLFENLTMG